MNWLIQTIGKLFGIHFAPDNHVIPVLRWGRYHRVKGPGLFWIMPLFEKALPAVKTSIHVGDFFFEEVLSKDNIPFQIQVTVLFIFAPNEAIKEAAAQLVRAGDALLQTIVREFTNRRLRRMVATFNAEELSGDEVVAKIEKGLVHYLKYEMSRLGLKPLKAHNGGVMIKEVIAPEKFKRTMLDVKHDEAILEVLRGYPVPELVQLLNQVIFANSLKDHSGQLALMMGAPEIMPMLSLLGQHQGYGQNGNNR